MNRCIDYSIQIISHLSLRLCLVAFPSFLHSVSRIVGPYSEFQSNLEITVLFLPADTSMCCNNLQWFVSKSSNAALKRELQQIYRVLLLIWSAAWTMWFNHSLEIREFKIPLYFQWVRHCRIKSWHFLSNPFMSEYRQINVLLSSFERIYSPCNKCILLDKTLHWSRHIV